MVRHVYLERMTVDQVCLHGVDVRPARQLLRYDSFGGRFVSDQPHYIIVKTNIQSVRTKTRDSNFKRKF